MKFSKSGWFDKYIAYREDDPFEASLPSVGVKILSDDALYNVIDEAIYYHLQPTGLLYGLPSRPPFKNREYPKSKYFDTEDWVVLTFLESLFSCMVADRNYQLDGLLNEENRFEGVMIATEQYFLHGAPEENRKQLKRRLKSTMNRIGLSKEVHPLEAVFDERVRPQISLFDQKRPFANCFLFLELHGCLEWQRHVAVTGVSEEGYLSQIYEQQKELRSVTLQLLAAAAWADGAIGNFEGTLLDTMMSASGLSDEELVPIREMVENGAELDQVQIPSMPWIVRRYMLEMVLLTVMIDQQFTDSELEFVSQSVKRLDLLNSEFEQSKTALEIFFDSHPEHLQELNLKPAVFNFRDRIQQKATRAIRDNLDRLVNEIKETHELYVLLMKATHDKLTPEEQRKVNDQLMDILKTIPALAIFALPGGGIILPILIRLLPFNLLPSSFDD